MERNHRLVLRLLVAVAALARGQQVSKQENKLADILLDRARPSAPVPASKPLAPSPPQKSRAPAVAPSTPSQAAPRRSDSPSPLTNNKIWETSSKVDLANRMLDVVSPKPERKKITLDLDSHGDIPTVAPEYASKLKDAEAKISELQKKLTETAPIVSQKKQQTPDGLQTKLKEKIATESLYQKVQEPAASQKKQLTSEGLQTKLRATAAKESSYPYQKMQNNAEQIAASVAGKTRKQKSDEAVAQMDSYQKMQEALAREISSAARGAPQNKLSQAAQAKTKYGRLSDNYEDYLSNLKRSEASAISNLKDKYGATNDPYATIDAYQKKLREAGVFQKNPRESNSLSDIYQNKLHQAQRQSDPYATVGAYPKKVKDVLEAKRLKEAEDRRREEAQDALMEAFNMDSDGLNDLDEFVEGAEQDHGLLGEADADGDNAVDIEELAQLLGNVDSSVKRGSSSRHRATPAKYLNIAASVMQNLDADSDGKVSIDEILDILDDGIHDSLDFKGWHKGFKEADRNKDMQLNVGELANLFSQFDETEL